jgi:Ca-activated chloride channel homolog
LTTETQSQGFSVVDSESGKPIELAMQRLWLKGKILPVGAHLRVQHTFRCGETKPVEVIYTFALPRDAALRQFIVAGEGFRTRSRLEPTEKAVHEYEEAIGRGNLATLARQYADGLVSLMVGNLRPQEAVVVLLEVLAGVEAHDDGLRFRFPFTLAPSYHRRARAVTSEPGVGEIDLPEDEFDGLILPRYHKDATGLHEVGFALTITMAQSIAEISSPSHPLRVKTADGEGSRVMLSTGRDVPDRDLVLDVVTRNSQSLVLSGTAKDGRTRFAAVVPSHSFGEAPTAPRQVVFVLDRSGSMGGPPITQAKKALEACLGALDGYDEFGIIAFDDQIESFDSGLHKADKSNRDKAHKFLESIDARGGTELPQALTAAVKLLDRTSGDVLIVTDGQVLATEQILAESRACRLRIHCLGIGSASQDRFLTLLARETGGVCRFLTPRERVDLAAVELFASLGRPIASEISARVEGMGAWRIAPDPAGAVFAGTPLTFFGESVGSVAQAIIEWPQPTPGKLQIPVGPADHGLGETLRLLQGSRLITDLEARYTSDASASAIERREQKRLGDQLQALSEAYVLASRRMSLVAVVERAGDRPGELPKTTVVPVGMPQDVAMQAYFGQSASPGVLFSLAAPSVAAPAPPTAASRFLRMFASKSKSMQAPEEIDGLMDFDTPAFSRHRQARQEDALLALARQLEPDGGMPGMDESERVAGSLIAILVFLSEGHTHDSGAFRAHVQRLLHFLETSEFPTLNKEQRDALDAALAWIKKKNEPVWSLDELLSWNVDTAWQQIMRMLSGGV